MNTIVAIPFDSELASFIGKRGSENSITFYNRKFNEHVVVGIMPSSIEEKFYALPQCMLVADQILVSTKSVDRSFGEVLMRLASREAHHIHQGQRHNRHTLWHDWRQILVQHGGGIARRCGVIQEHHTPERR